MNTYTISLDGHEEKKGDLPKISINSIADSAVEACEAARTIVSTFTHHEYLSVHWRIEPCEDGSADLEIVYKDRFGEMHKEIFGHCEPLRHHSDGEVPKLRLIVGR